MPRHRISQYINLDEALYPTDIGGTTANTGFIAMGDASTMTAVFLAASDYTDATCVITAKSATAAAGTGSQTLTGLGGTLDAASEMGVFELNADNMYSGGATAGNYTHVAFEATEASNTGVDYVAALVLKDGCRFKQDTATLNSNADVTDNI